MPEIGEVTTAKKIGHKSGNKVMWAACPDCGKEHWVYLDNRRPKTSCCRSCVMKRKNWIGSNHPAWKGGRKIRKHKRIKGKIILGQIFLIYRYEDGDWRFVENINSDGETITEEMY